MHSDMHLTCTDPLSPLRAATDACWKQDGSQKEGEEPPPTGAVLAAGGCGPFSEESWLCLPCGGGAGPALRAVGRPLLNERGPWGLPGIPSRSLAFGFIGQSSAQNTFYLFPFKTAFLLYPTGVS